MEHEMILLNYILLFVCTLLTAISYYKGNFKQAIFNAFAAGINFSLVLRFLSENLK